MPVNIKTNNDVLVAFIKGEIDHHTSPLIRDLIDDAVVSTEKAKRVILNFSEVTFMDSSGVGLVMGRYRLCSQLGKTLSVTDLSERDYFIMKMSGIEKIAEISKKGNEK